MRKLSKAGTKCQDMWQAMDIGEEITTGEMCDIIGTEVSKETQCVSSLLKRFVNKGIATRVRNPKGRNRYTYTKTSDADPTSYKSRKLKPKKEKPELAKHEDKEFNLLELGEAIFQMIENLKHEISGCETTIDNQRTEISNMSKEKHMLQNELEKHKAKILELNNLMASGSKTLSLSKLSDFTKGLRK